MKKPAGIRGSNIAVGLMWFLSIFGVVGIITLIAFINTQKIIMLFVGLLFSLTWIVVIPLAKHNFIQSSLQKKGIRLLTQYVEVIDEGKEKVGEARVSNNGEPSSGPFFIKTSWYDHNSNTLYYFQSNLLIKNPQPHLRDIHGIYVYVDPQNFHHNYMDLSFLPPKFLKKS